MNTRYFVSCFVCRQTQAGPEFLQLLRALARRDRFGDPSSLVPNYMGGTWQLVTGKIEPTETAHAAALRELFEETTLKPLDFFQINRVNTFYVANGDAIVHVPMFCAVVDPSAQVKLNPEHTDFRWLSRNVFAGQLMWPGERDAFAELCREILDDGPAKKHLRIELNHDPG